MVEAIGAVVQIILGYMQLAGAGVDSQIPSTCFTIALIAVTAARSLPSSKALEICIFFLISGCAALFSSAVPNTFRWLPYFSCVCPLFNLLPLPFQHRILHFCQYIWEAIKCYVCSLFDMLPVIIQQYSLSVGNAVRQLVIVDPSQDAQSSLSAEANFDLEMGNRAAAACLDLQIPSLCFTMALTAARSLPSSKALRIFIFFLILGCDVVLSKALPNMLRWLPYFSCVRPVFNLLPESIQQYFESVWNEMRRLPSQLLSHPYQQRPTWTWRRVIEIVLSLRLLQGPRRI